MRSKLYLALRGSLPDGAKAAIMEKVPSVLVISTDGGTDHRNTLLQVKSAMLALSLFLEIDMTVFFRNAPDGPWTNTVERVMCAGSPRPGWVGRAV